MEKRITKLEDTKIFVTRGSGHSLALDVDTSRASRMLQIENRDILAVEAQPLFYIEDIYLRPGDRVALLGYNGAGKTTLIHQIMQRYRTGSGFVKINPQCPTHPARRPAHALPAHRPERQRRTYSGRFCPQGLRQARGGHERRREGDSDEAKLHRLIDLEALLEADQARKRRFQKPRLQQQWRAQIEQLGLSLG
jgi:ATPase subunit of ABC transporter with duplicated ATPase domains